MDGGMEELGMPTLVQFARRPIVVIWCLALLATAVALAALRLPPATSAALGGAALVAVLIGLGDWMAVALEEIAAVYPGLFESRRGTARTLDRIDLQLHFGSARVCDGSATAC